MKLKKLAIVSLILFAILTISAVSASDNITDTDVGISEETSLEINYPDEPYDPDDLKWNITLEQDCFNYGWDNVAKVYAPTLDPKRTDFNIDNDTQYVFKYDSSDDSYSADISSLSLGEHILYASYRGDNIHPTKIFEKPITVTAEIVCDETYVYGTGEVALRLPDNATGNLTMRIGNTTVYNDHVGILYANVKLINGIATIPVSNFTVGKHFVRLNYTGDDYNVYFKGGYFEVLPKIDMKKEIFYGETLPITFTGNPDSTGKIVIEYNGENIAEIDLNFVNGSAKTTLKDLRVGQADRIIIYFTDAENNMLRINRNVTVKPIFTAKDIEMSYYDGSTFKVKVAGKNGKIIVKQPVYIKIGDKTRKVTTDENGVAKLTIKSVPGKYTITTTYKEFTKTNKLTVKHILSLSTVKVKKSAKKLVLTAKLNKKVKGKKITFNFNGKTYTAKTDKKGVAKVTLEKSVLKKLKVGKTVKYQATYTKDTVQKTAIVKK